MGSFASNDVRDTVRAYIARNRVAEMRARGWRLLGPGGEGMVLMEGPDPDADGADALDDGATPPPLAHLWLRALERLETAAA